MLPDGADGDLDDCGCCAPGADPDSGTTNRPGLPALRYRLATHAGFLRRMKSRLAAVLPALTTRAPDDPSLAMLDAGATVCDILAFYQERIANEGFLRTAGERRSVLELARAIGYELNPGVAAGTFLAFSVEDPPPLPLTPTVPNLPLPPPPILIPSTITIAAGTKAQSIPGQGELPQTFETSEEIEARVCWNAMRARPAQRQQLSVEGGLLKRLDPADAGAAAATCGAIWLAGTATGLKPGDLMAVQVTAANIDAGDPISKQAHKGMALVTVAAVSSDDVGQRTRVDLAVAGAAAVPAFGFPDRPAGEIETAPIKMARAAVKNRVFERAWAEADLEAFIDIQRWDGDALAKQVGALAAGAPPAAAVYVFRQRVGFFGNAAPPSATLQTIDRNPWVNFDSNAPTDVWHDSIGHFYSAVTDSDVFLERAVAGLLPHSLVGLMRPGLSAPILFTIREAFEESRADFAISGRSTGLQVNRETDLTKPIAQWNTRVTNSFKSSDGAAFKMRRASLFVQSEALPLADAPIGEPVAAPAPSDGSGALWQPTATVVLDRMVLGLRSGQAVAASGALVDSAGKLTGDSGREIAILDGILHTGGFTVLTFSKPLGAMYERTSFAISANVARATHGERQPVVPTQDRAQEEILGDGDGTLANQTFALRQSLLTYVSAATPSGRATTLTVRVNGVAWTEVPSLYGQEPAARLYTVRLDDDGTTRVIFGDGVAGARLPTGRGNVTATYRTGIGLSGQVKPGQITLLQSRPLGLKNVVNPAGAVGAQDPEALDDARVNAVRTVRTLDRVVSLADYEDFARSFAGVGKAQALEVWSGQIRLVHITVATASGDALDPLSDLGRYLIAGLASAGDPTQPVQVASFAARFFTLSASLLVDPARDAKAVRAAAESAIARRFAFAQRAFAQPVTEAEIMGVLHQIPGVVAVEVSALHATDQPVPSLSGVLPAAPARFDPSTRTVLPAQLLLLQPAALHLSATAAPGRTP